MQVNKLTFIIVILSFLSFQSANAQTPYDESQKFFDFIRKNTNTEKIKDSLAHYTCYIKISVDRKNNYKPVIKSSDEKVSGLITGVEILGSYNYRTLMGKSKSVIFILPISIIVLDSSYDPRRLDATVNDKISKLFYSAAPEDEHKKIVYLSPLNYMVFKRM